MDSWLHLFMDYVFLNFDQLFGFRVLYKTHTHIFGDFECIVKMFFVESFLKRKSYKVSKKYNSVKFYKGR